MERDYRHRVPLESAVITFMPGGVWVLVPCLLLLLAAFIRETFRRQPASQGPFYTPALARTLGER